LGRAQLAAQAHQLGSLVGVETLMSTAVDLVLFHPPAQARGGDAEIGSHLGYGLVTGSGQLDRPLAELVWIAHWHRDILPSDASRRLMFGVRQGGGSS
jgi:hypothetical protein